MNNRQYKTIQKLLQQIGTETQINHHEDWVRERLGVADTEVLKNKLTHNDLDILSNLLENPLTISDVVEKMAITQGGISRRINHLERQGLLKKFHKAPNKKTVYVELTATGKKMAQVHNELHQKIQSEQIEAVKDFSEADVEMIINFLERISK